ncbi:MAG: 7TM diverse intracellular signaling domain-containing protein [Arachidicoccus sp.]|nr:7TM diverse intracellular signaling domain-containing protein [Arachidicoccus sp.]
MRCFRHLCVSVILLISFCFAFGQQSGVLSNVAIRGFSDSVLKAGQIFYFIDSSKFLSLAQVQQKQFYLLDKSVANNLLHKNIWLKFALQNNSPDTLRLIILTGELNYTQLYFYSGGKIFSEAESGNLRNADKAKTYAEQTSLSLKLSLLPYKQGDVYVKIRQITKDYSFNGITILSNRQLNYETGYVYFYFRFHGIIEIFFMGFICCQIIYILMQWLAIKRKEYQFYFLYLLALILFYMSFEEYYFGRIILFQRFPALAIYVNVALQVIAYYFYYRFIWYFLDVAAIAPKLSKQMKKMEYFLLAYFVFDLVFIIATFDVTLENQVFTFVDIILFFITAYFIVYLFRKHRNPLIYFVLSGSLCVGIGNMLGEIFSTIEQTYHVTIGTVNKLWYSQLGIMIEIVCFTAGLGYKNRMNEKEKIASQQKLIEQLRENQALQNKMQNIRDKIARDLHDDVGATLSTVMLYSNAARQKENILSKNELMDFINKIGETSAQMIDDMSDIVWAVNPRNDTMKKIFSRMQAFAAPLCAANNIELSFNTDDNLQEETLPMDKRKNIYLIFKEAMNNAVKYASCSKIFIEILKKEKDLHLMITDNGKGFDLQCHADGNGLSNMSHRAMEMKGELYIHTEIGKGTFIDLSIKLII